jgi:CHAT domain-containing protein/tetratricopeptide (TPR) repeat protein
MDTSGIVGLFSSACERVQGGAAAPQDEAACLALLDQLFALLSQRMEWAELAGQIARAEALPLRAPQHRRRVALYAGYAAVRLGDHARGQALILGALDHPETEPDLRLHGLNALAQSHSAQNQFDQALHWYQRMREQAIAGGQPIFEALALINMSWIYNELERYDRALECSTESLAIFRAGGEAQREAYALYAVGRDAMHLGRWEVALEHLGLAEERFLALELRGGLIALYWALGFIHHLRDDGHRSLEAYQRALAVIETHGDSNPFSSMDVFSWLGLLHQTSARYPEALDAYEQALSRARALGHTHRAYQVLYQRGRVYAALGRASEAEGALLEAIGALESLRESTGREDVKLSLIGTTQQIYETYVLLLVGQGRLADAFHYAERARARAMIDTLTQRSPEVYRALEQPIVSLAEVQAALAERELLLEYYTTGVRPPGEHLLNRLTHENRRLWEQLVEPPRTLVFAITAGAIAIRELALDPNRLLPGGEERYPGRQFLYGRLPQALYERLVAPVEGLVEACGLLYLIPHGPLHHVPFSALRDGAGRFLLRSDGPALAQAPSATVLLRSCLGRPGAADGISLAIGYNDPGGRQPLRFAEAEARHAAWLLGGEAWADGDAVSERLIALGPRVRRLHIAGHARFHPADPLASELLVGQDDLLTARAMIERLSLGADLVVLNSCTSGLTSVVPGDELLGLQRAMLYAGARTLICTRWEANDLVALLVMDHFYAALGRGVTAALALRDALVAVRELRADALAALVAGWRAGGGPLAALGDEAGAIFELLAAQAGERPDARPFDDPLLWAAFMLIGSPAGAAGGGR